VSTYSSDIETQETGVHCPHCFLVVEAGVELPWPRAPLRCPHCRLMIGPGRARASGSARAGARGTAAGVFAHDARREENPGEPTPEAVRTAIRSVAAKLGHPPHRLLMIDYAQEASADPSLPALTSVFASFGSWKRARREAAADP
jgi:hypothetical protein